MLCKRPGWVFSRSQIVDAVRGDNYPVTERSVDVQMVGLRKKLDSLHQHILIGGIVAALLATAASLLFSRRVSRPLEIIREGVGYFAQGDLSYRLPVLASKETELLARTMNDMAASLDERMHTIVAQRNALEAVLSSLIEGVIAIDPEEKILSINQRKDAMDILIVEDDPSSRMMLSKIVSHQGHRVFTASNGREAWEIFQQESIPIVITDWLMPEMNGKELCRNIRSSLKDSYTYIIVATCINAKNDLVEILKSGVDDYILQPVHVAELNARIKTGERIIRLEDNHLTLQQTVIESRNKLRVLLDSLPEEIVSIDKNTCIVSANTAFLKDKGIPFSQAVGTPCFEARYWHLPLPLISHLKGHALDVFNSVSARFTMETVADSGKPERHFEFNMLPIHDDSGTVQQVVIVSKDISADLLQSEQIRSLNHELKKALSTVQDKNLELVKTLEQLKETQSQMLQSEKMASIGQLAAGVAHEINNPVGFVSSNLKTLADYIQDISQILSETRKLTALFHEAEGREPAIVEMEALAARIWENESDLDIDYIMGDMPGLIQESRDGLDRIKKIVLDLKNFSHPGEENMKMTDINQSLDSTLNIVWNELKYKASIVKDYADVPEVRCYPQQLNQVFMNLLVNAAQSIEKQGEIRIATRQNGDQVEIAISDTGQGIPEKILNRIFDPFFTTKPVGKGTGLGLNVSYNIIKKHEGTITVHSELGKGTTFLIRIPVNGPAEHLSESV